MARFPAGLRGGAMLAVLMSGCAPEASTPAAGLSLSEMLGGADTAGYARALAPRAFRFPDDHGPHPDFRSEWWYVTGNLDTPDGREVGYQLTIFRSALSARPREGTSRWGTRQAFMAHFTITDVTSAEFHAFDRFGRGALDIAGARADPFRVWLGGWSLESVSDSATFPVALQASGGSVSLGLMLDAGKPVVLQGDSGLSRKGPEEGNASYYYSLTRMPTTGSVVLGTDTLSVSGLSWLDREWSTSVLSPDLVGWDWFALQLDTGWDLVLYRLRRGDGTVAPFSEAVLVDPDGLTERLAWGEGVVVTEVDTWASPIDGTRYPSEWRVRIPSHGWDVVVEPALPDQELDLAFRYWEGSVRVHGTIRGDATLGRGYVELTGYVGR